MVTDTKMDEFLGSLHETAVGLHKIGVINDAEMREYDRNCIDREDEISREDNKTPKSQPVTPAFAQPY
jgi:DNA-binding transcriptional regulator YiaG